MKQPLAIVGASGRSAAASAVRASLQPIAADLFADADLRATATATRIAPYPEGLVDWLRAIEPPAWMYTGALENHPELVDQMAWIAPLWGNAGDVLARVRSPWNLAEALRGAGLLFPETRSSSDDLPRDGSWLEKSYRGASGSGVRELSGERGAGSRDSSQFLRAPGSELPACFQRRIAGTPCAAVFIAAEGAAVLLGITRQLVGEVWLGAHGFQYAGSIGPFPADEATLAAIERIGNLLAERFELTGLFGVDFILNSAGVWTLEVNPRYTASVEILERATGVQAIAVHAAACRGLRIADRGLRIEAQRAGWSAGPAGIEDDPARHKPQVHGKAIVFAKRDVIISEPLAQSSLMEAMKTPWPTLADVSPAGTTVDAGRPVLTVFADGANDNEVELRLRARIAEIETRIYAGEVTS